MFGIAWRWSVCCVLLCLVSALLVRAEEIPAEHQPDPIPIVETEEVVVSATKTPVPVSQVTSAVEVITAQDMKNKTSGVSSTRSDWHRGSPCFRAAARGPK